MTKRIARVFIPSLLILLGIVAIHRAKAQGSDGVASAYPTIAPPTAMPANTEVQIASTGIATLPTSGNPIYVVHAFANIVVPANSPDTLLMLKLYSVESTSSNTSAPSQIGQAFFVRLTPTTTAQTWYPITFAVDLTQGTNIAAGFTNVNWIVTAKAWGPGTGISSSSVQIAVIQAA